MTSVIALDLGGSTIDMVEFCPTTQVILQKKSLESLHYPEKDIATLCKDFQVIPQLKKHPQLHITGASALNFPEIVTIEESTIALKKVIEFESIAKGGEFLSQKTEGLVVSLGTGTAMVAFSRNSWEHVRGTGIGGGTFMSLGKALLGTDNFQELKSLAQKGKSSNIDLSVGDIAGGDLGILPADMTAANFAKYSAFSQKEDIALGIANLIAQPIASLAIEKAKRLGLKNIIVGGKFSRLDILVQKMQETAQYFDIQIITPKNAGFMTTIGACCG